MNIIIQLKGKKVQSIQLKAQNMYHLQQRQKRKQIKIQMNQILLLYIEKKSTNKMQVI